MNIDKNKVKRILIIKLKGIGDVILSTVVFDNLKANFPEASIDFLTEKPSLNALANVPVIGNVLIFDKNSSPLSSLQIISNVRKRKYDLVFDFYSNPRTALITFLSGARYRAGFPYRGREYAYNIKGPSERAKFHAALLHLEFLKFIGLSVTSDNMYFGLSDEDKSFADEFFKSKFSSNDFVVGISPSGGWPSKKCDPVKFAEIADSISDKYNARILILWGPGDQEQANEIKELMKNETVFAPLTDIRKMGALIGKCSMVVANDSGPMHISTAVKIPTLSLHGPTDPNLQGPFGSRHEWIRNDKLDCICCNLLECPRHHECFLQLDVNKVMDKIDKIIRKNNIIVSANEKN